MAAHPVPMSWGQLAGAKSYSGSIPGGGRKRRIVLFRVQISGYVPVRGMGSGSTAETW